MITDISLFDPQLASLPENMGAIAASLNLDEDYIRRTRILIRSHLDGLVDDYEQTFTHKRLQTIGGIVYRLFSLAKTHHYESIESVFDSWKSGTLIVSLSLQSSHSSLRKDEDGFITKGGLFGFLKNACPRRIVINKYDEEMRVPAAPRKEVRIREIMEQVFEPLGIAKLTRNGKAQVTSFSIMNLPNLMILGEVVEQMIIDWKCFEAVPAFHRALRCDYNYVFGKQTYCRKPEDGTPSLNCGTFEAIKEEVEAACPAIAQSPEKAILSGSQLGMAYLQYCCRKVYSVRDGVVEAAVQINNKMIDVAKSTRFEFGEMKKNIEESVVSALKTGKVALFGIVESLDLGNIVSDMDDDEDDLFAEVKTRLGITLDPLDLYCPY